MHEAIAPLNKASKILRRVAADDHPFLLEYSLSLEVGTGRDSPCSIQGAWYFQCHALLLAEDEAKMVKLFVALHAQHGNSSSASVSSEGLQQGLRMYGLFNFTPPSSDPVSGRKKVALPVDCHSLVPPMCVRVCIYVCL